MGCGSSKKNVKIIITEPSLKSSQTEENYSRKFILGHHATPQERGTATTNGGKEGQSESLQSFTRRHRPKSEGFDCDDADTEESKKSNASTLCDDESNQNQIDIKNNVDYYKTNDNCVHEISNVDREITPGQIIETLKESEEISQHHQKESLENSQPIPSALNDKTKEQIENDKRTTKIELIDVENDVSQSAELNKVDISSSSRADQPEANKSQGGDVISGNDSLTIGSSQVSVPHGKNVLKSSLFTSLDVFRDVDAYALEAPDRCKTSFESLAVYLTSPFDSDLLRFRAIWRWVTSNIEYDTEVFFNQSVKTSPSNDNVLQTGKGVCDGYASCVMELCRNASIEIKKITGYAKGFHYRAGNIIKGTKTNHAWNAVKLKGQWWLCDFTWGAGYVDNDKRFQWNYTEHYFLTDPEEFILDHFPEEEEWQLISPCYTIEQFEKWAKFYKHFFINQLKPVSHKEGVIVSSNGEAEIILQTKMEVDISCKLLRTSESSSKDLSEYCFCYQNGNQAFFLARLPEIGNYEMKLFSKNSTNTKSYDSIASYVIDCQSISKDCQVFPKTFSSWLRGYVLHRPTNGLLPRNQSIKFAISAPGVKEMFVCVSGGEGEWLPIIQDDDGVWQSEVSFKSNSEVANVVVKVEGQSSTTYSSILKYAVQ